MTALMTIATWGIFCVIVYELVIIVELLDEIIKIRSRRKQCHQNSTKY